jgi:hypothetical protein
MAWRMCGGKGGGYSRRERTVEHTEAARQVLTRKPPQKGGLGRGSPAGTPSNLALVASTRPCSVARSGMGADWGLDHAPMLYIPVHGSPGTHTSQPNRMA